MKKTLQKWWIKNHKKILYEIRSIATTFFAAFLTDLLMLIPSSSEIDIFQAVQVGGLGVVIRSTIKTIIELTSKNETRN